jgi:hypothetical protein
MCQLKNSYWKRTEVSLFIEQIAAAAVFTSFMEYPRPFGLKIDQLKVQQKYWRGKVCKH